MKDTDQSLVIVDGVRTPFLKMGSDFAGIDATEQGRVVVQTLLTRTGIDPRIVDELIFGCVSQPADATNVARVISLRAGLPETTPAMTVHRNCASGLEALTTAAERVAAGRGEVFIVGGTESMSRIPLFFSVAAAAKFAMLSRAKTAGGRAAAVLNFRPADFAPEIGLRLGLTDPVSGLNMGETAEVLAREFGISREAQDQFALDSHLKAAKSRDAFADEICPVYLPGSKTGFVDQDNGIRIGQTMEALARLKPAFERRTGTVTPGNSSQITDGAVALLVMTEAKAESLGLDAKGGLMERAERIVVLCIGLFIEPWVEGALMWILWGMLVLISITAVQRFVKVWKQAAVAPVTQARIDLRRERRSTRREARTEMTERLRTKTRIPVKTRVPRRKTDA